MRGRASLEKPESEKRRRFPDQTLVGCGFPLFKSDSPRRAFGKTVSHAVAVIVADEFRFAVYHGDSSFVACGHAGAAAVTFFPIDMNDLPFHNFSVKVSV